MTMRALLNKIVGGRTSRSRQLIASIGYILGLTMALLSTQLYFPLRNLLTPRSDYYEYLVLSKQVQLKDALFPSRAEFTNEEIEELAAQDFVRRWAVFTASQFRVKANVGGQLNFSSELFLESIPIDFLDVRPSSWEWSDDSDFLPLIMSQDFLNLYNFGYAISSGLPKLSPTAARAIPIEVTVAGPGGKQEISARIVGFSQRVQSILVPQSFMNWANLNIAQVEAPQPSKILLHLEPRSQSDLKEFAERHGLQVNQDQLSRGQAIMALNIAVGVVIGLGLLFVVLAVTVLILNFSVQLTAARDELRLLGELGYTPKLLTRHLTQRLWLSCLVNALLAALLFIGTWFALGMILSAQGLKQALPIGHSIHPMTIPVGLLFLALTLAFALTFFYRLINSLINPPR
jgi:hypothetical protein